MVTVGNLVQAGQNGGGSVLTSIVSVDPIYAYFDVDEHAALRIRMLMREGKMKGTAETEWPVSLGVGMDRGFPHQGIIDFIDNQINSKTGTLRARGVFPNQNEALTPGLFARIRVPIGAPHQAVLINERTLDNDQAQKVVYVVNEKNEVVSRPVRVGALHAGLRAIEEGLRPGERVVVNGIQQVRPGAIVEPKLVEMPQSKSAKVAIGTRPPELNRAQSVAANRKPEIGS
jgi:RND family efflux transporter MFP subunit